MKKSKKFDLKKLAMLGIAGGAMVSTDAVANDALNPSELLAFNGCGGAHGCQGGSAGGHSGGAYQAYRNTPSNYYYNTPSYDGAYYSQPSYSQPSYSQPSQGWGDSYGPQGQYYSPSYSQPSAGCGGAYAPQGQYYGTSQGCGGIAQPQSHFYSHQSGNWSGNYAPQANYQATQGCGGIAPSTTQLTAQPQSQSQTQWSQPTAAAPASENWSQWETSGITADTTKYNAKPATTNSMSSTRADMKRTLTETELLSQLNETGKETYRNLDSAGKALALKLAAEGSYKDKNEAVEAARKISEKRAKAPAAK